MPFLYKATRCFRETLRLKMPSVKDRIASLQSSARPGSPVVSRLAAAGRRNKGANRPATARLVQSAPVDASERGEPASPYPAADELRSARVEVEALKAQVEALSTELANLKEAAPWSQPSEAEAALAQSAGAATPLDERSKVARELLQTERSYAAAVQLAATTLVGPMREASLLSELEVHKAFGGLERSAAGVLKVPSTLSALPEDSAPSETSYTTRSATSAAWERAAAPVARRRPAQS